eukprot:318281-Pelagomonas_calceolata.AAC.6
MNLLCRHLCPSAPQQSTGFGFSTLPGCCRCNFHNSCKAIKGNKNINGNLRKLVLGCETGTHEASISQIVSFQRVLEHLVLCSRLPITSGFREMHTLRDPEPLGQTLIKLADATCECKAARERLAALRYLTLQQQRAAGSPPMLDPDVELSCGP